MENAYLILSDGTVFEGYACGAETEAVGELVFTTGMCGYLETLTDPSYCGQIVVQTFPLIGNYGVIPEDFEGICAVKGYVVRELCGTPSNFRSEGPLNEFLKKQNVPGICGVDTRELTRILREQGVMNAILCRSIPEDLTPLKTYAVHGSVEQVTCRETAEYPAEGKEKYRVTLIDYGAKKNIRLQLQKRGCRVRVVPAGTSAEEILAEHSDGIMLSNGPGDPAENRYQIQQLQKLFGTVPMFGICLGHQLLALAAGGKTEKLKYGHRGSNQPVQNKDGSRTYITSQNHGYAVLAQTVPGAELSYRNANDGTCEGLEYPGKNAFSVQFHPEARSGPQDTAFLFDEFIARMGG